MDTAYILHKRNFTDSKCILELFCQNAGRVQVVQRMSQKKRSSAFFQPFVPYSVSWQGRSDLKTLLMIEAESSGVQLQSTRLYCGLYLNELLCRALLPGEAHTTLYQAYQTALQNISILDDVELALRQFELVFLQDMGYGINFSSDSLGDLIQDGVEYQYFPDEGFVKVSADVYPKKKQILFSGHVIRAISHGGYSCDVERRALKILCREAIKIIIGDKPLLSRSLFQ
ncbi:DNA repair protein RecO [Teredinibacter sp. KSP-S5-2]|uniref:DNA repair protein RecO n=1 Tax=Teredinibacter sp. KSP-S5-2 TaxID=3034506 RepID=UPI0029349673|nr:DNA repair protein RecO [Teredinibacter sp. KSP-S5-2]WNO08011.1 DNA repair protein RecO [Teredinibacter sp. KSP-S5-2]